MILNAQTVFIRSQTKSSAARIARAQRLMKLARRQMKRFRVSRDLTSVTVNRARHRIYHLKSQMKTLRKRLRNSEAQNQELRDNLTILALAKVSEKKKEKKKIEIDEKIERTADDETTRETRN